MTGVQLRLDGDRPRPRRGPPGGGEHDLHPAPGRHPAAGAQPRQRRHPAGADPLREGRGPAGLVPRDGGFVYDTSVSPGNGTDDLVAFLSQGPGGRRGYCEQFASAMAVMARMLGIPARVPVGFLQPERVGRGTVGVQRPRPARLAGAVLPRCRAGCASSRRRASGPGACRRTPPSRCRSATRPAVRRPGCPATSSPHRGRRAPRQHPRGAGAGRRPPAGRRAAWRWPLLGGAVVAGSWGAAAAAPRPAPAAPGAPPGRRPRGRLGRAAGHRDRPRRAVAGRPLAAGDRHGAGAHFGAPVDENTRRRPAHGPDVAPDADARAGPARPRARAGALRPGRRRGRARPHCTPRPRPASRR